MSDDVVGFFGGSLLGSVAAFQWLWPLQIEHFGASDFAVMWVIKIIGTTILGFLGGLFGMFGKDAYRAIKRKLNNNEQQD